jgi:hypothetical protein
MLDGLQYLPTKVGILFDIVDALCNPEANNNDSAIHFKKIAIEKASNIINNSDLMDILTDHSVGYLYFVISVVEKNSSELIRRSSPLGDYYDIEFIILPYLKNLKNSNDLYLPKFLCDFVDEESVKAIEVMNRINHLSDKEIEKLSSEKSFKELYTNFNNANSLEELYNFFMRVHKEKGSSWANSFKLSIITCSDSMITKRSSIPCSFLLALLRD